MRPKQQQTRRENQVRITGDMVKSWVTDGFASAIQKVNEDAEKIAAQMTAELTTNKSKTSSNTIRMGALIKLDGETRQAKITGSYGFTTPNLGDESDEVVREIPDPNQPAICGNCGKEDCQLCSKDPETLETGKANPEEENDG
jgi:hypothetical protein